MEPITPENSEDQEQIALLRRPLGEPGSGLVRYGAAMYFFRRGKLNTDRLEAYRICCNLDWEDPDAVARSRSA